MTPAEREAALNAANRQIASRIKPLLPQGAGFALLVFDMGSGGFMTYVSNADRPSMVKALRELIGKLES